MGLFSDISSELYAMLYPVEDYIKRLIPDKLEAMLYSIETEVAWINIKAAQASLMRVGGVS